MYLCMGALAQLLTLLPTSRGCCRTCCCRTRAAYACKIFQAHSPEVRKQKIDCVLQLISYRCQANHFWQWHISSQVHELYVLLSLLYTVLGASLSRLQSPACRQRPRCPVCYIWCILCRLWPPCMPTASSWCDFAGAGAAGEGLHEVAVRDEERDLWSVYLTAGNYALATRHTRTQVRAPCHTVPVCTAAQLFCLTVLALRHCATSRAKSESAWAVSDCPATQSKIMGSRTARPGVCRGSRVTYRGAACGGMPCRTNTEICRQGAPAIKL